MRATAWLVIFAAVTFSVIVSQLVGFACTSGEETPGSLEANLCDWYAGSLGFASALAVLWPAIAFGASQVVPTLRLQPLLVAMWIAALAAAFWVATAIVVVDVG